MNIRETVIRLQELAILYGEETEVRVFDVVDEEWAPLETIVYDNKWKVLILE